MNTAGSDGKNPGQTKQKQEKIQASLWKNTLLKYTAVAKDAETAKNRCELKHFPQSRITVFSAEIEDDAVFCTLLKIKQKMV